MKQFNILLLTLLVCITNISCSSNDENTLSQDSDYVVEIESKQIVLKLGESQIITPNFNNKDAENIDYIWSAQSQGIVEIIESGNNSITVTALKIGKTIIKIESEDKKVFDVCEIVVVKKDPIKILAIGNSFSEDAVENNLYDLAKSEGIELIIGNMYIGGCSLNMHWDNASHDKAAYEYRKINVEGNLVRSYNVKLSTALNDEEWDYISIQQVSSSSGKYDTYESHLPLIMNYIKEKSPQKDTKYILHQTWAYARNSTHASFPDYNSNQDEMYNAIVDATQRAGELVDIDMIIPSGTAIQNGRTSLVGDEFCNDGHHLNHGVGRYTAACTWFEKITGINVINNSFYPSTVSSFEALLAQNAAHLAVENPNQVTEMVDFKSKKLEYPIYIDFGTNKSSNPWNNVTSTASTSPSILLIDAKNNYTGVKIKVTDSFYGSNDEGMATNSVTELDLPYSVYKDAFWGNAYEATGGRLDKEGVFLISNLDNNIKYEFIIFASRSNCSDNRETQYTFKGKNGVVCYLNAANNTSNITKAKDMYPNEKGEISLNVTAGPNNNNQNGFYYINAMSISPQ